jgi:hypothetical protein
MGEKVIEEKTRETRKVHYSQMKGFVWQGNNFRYVGTLTIKSN